MADCYVWYSGRLRRGKDEVDDCITCRKVRWPVNVYVFMFVLLIIDPAKSCPICPRDPIILIFGPTWSCTATLPGSTTSWRGPGRDGAFCRAGIGCPVATSNFPSVNCSTQAGGEYRNFPSIPPYTVHPNLTSPAFVGLSAILADFLPTVGADGLRLRERSVCRWKGGGG